MTMQERINQIMSTVSTDDELTLGEINELIAAYNNDKWDLITAAFMLGFDAGRKHE